LAYVLVLVRVSSQRVFWLAVIVGVDGEDVSDDTAAVVVLDGAVVVVDGAVVVVDDGEGDDTTVVGACRVVDGSVVVVEVEGEDVASAVVAEGTRSGLVAVVEDETAVPKTLSSAALVQAWPLISDKATRRT